MTTNVDLTSKENLAIDLLLEYLGEERCGRSAGEYGAIIAWIQRQPLKSLHDWVNAGLTDLNNKLAESKAQGHPTPKICYFKRGDMYPKYEDLPTTLSVETIRSALVKWGVPLRRPRKRLTK